MEIRIQGRNYLVLHRQGENQAFGQYVCRKAGKADGRDYLAVQIPTSRLRREMIRFLAAQEKNKHFHEFLDYATDSNEITFILDCGRGNTVEAMLTDGSASLEERTAVAAGMIRRLVLSDFPPYFIHAAMRPDRVKVTEAMDFSFAFDLSDFLEFDRVDFPLACQDMAGVLEGLFARERKKRAVPELESFLYRLRHGEFEDTLSVYQGLLAVTALWSGKGEEELEDKSLAFRIWGKIKGLGKMAAGFIRVAAVLLAALYLGFSVYRVLEPEAPGQGYEQIGDLMIRRGVPEGAPETGD